MNYSFLHFLYFSNATISVSSSFLYLLAFSLVLFGVYWVIRSLKRNQNQNAADGARQEQELHRVRSEKKKVEAINARLSKDMASKSQKLAATTLMVVRKNELLVQIKNELKALEESSNQVEPIIRVIDKNLNQTDDWELFKEAFNHTDRKFLKKLEKRHPNLSPNDIRLCAYLRLNLSSKEMAPLFNISVRSVEIKRYRLRKKLNLSHDENLVSYILKL